MVGVWVDESLCFCTGFEEQKARNLEHRRHVVITTGANSWAAGTDIVVEGDAERVTAQSDLERVAAAFLAKYGEDWRFEVGDGVFGSGDVPAAVFRVSPVKVLTFAKAPHGQTRYRFR